MQLIALAMPMGDKGKSKNKQLGSGVGTTDCQNRASQPSPDTANFPNDNGNANLTQLLDYTDANLFSSNTDILDRSRSLSLSTSVNIAPLLTSVSSLLPIFSLPNDISSARTNVALPVQYQECDDAMHTESTDDDTGTSPKQFEESSFLRGAMSAEDSSAVPSSETDTSPQTPSSTHFKLSVEISEAETNPWRVSDLNVDLSEEVDENMNQMCAGKYFVVNQIPLFKDKVSESTHADQTTGKDMELFSESSNEDNVRELTSDAKRDTSIQLVETDSDSADQCSSQLQPSSGKDSDSDMSNSLSNRPEHWEISLQGARTATFSPWQLARSYDRTPIEPPLWTSLALREYIIVLPHIVFSVPQYMLDMADGAIINHQHHRSAQSFAPEIHPPPELLGVQSTHCNDVGHSDLENDRDMPEGCVFQNCRMDHVETSLEAYVNDGSDGNGKEMELRHHRLFPLALEDLDQFLNTLSTVRDSRDMLLNQMMDDEVAMIRYNDDNANNDDDDDAEDELAGIDFSNDRIAEVDRPSNPIADALDSGGDEHFLPISPDVFQN